MKKKWSFGARTATFLGFIAAILTIWAVIVEPIVCADKGIRIRFPSPLEGLYVPSGWMGDLDNIFLSKLTEDLDTMMVPITQFKYWRGSQGWAGVYWQYPENNWGSSLGHDLTGAHSITFFARGRAGGEIVEFLSGGIRGDHNDTFKKSIGQVALSNNWRKYTIDLTGEDLTNIAGGFCWSAPAADDTLTFYLHTITLN